MTHNQLHTRTCQSCHYKALVTSSRHYVYSCEQEMDTVKCSRCQQLSVVAFTKEATYPHPTREEFRLINDADKEKYFRDFELCYQMYDPPMVCEPLEKIHCGWCNSTRTKVWDVNSSKCPKCGGIMHESKPEPFEISDIATYKSFEEMACSAPNVIAVCLEDWCIPCQILHPVINQIRKEYPGVFHFVEFNITYAEKNDLIKKYKMTGFPFFILFEQAKLIKVLSSPDTKVELVTKLRKYYKFDNLK
jgi:thioredoxin 1